MIRHGSPFPQTQSVCLGSVKDPGLSAEGEAQCRALRQWFGCYHVSDVYSSPMRRCCESAQLVFSKPAKIHEGLTELGMGDWEGRSFTEIKARYPDLYERRRLDPALVPPGGEPPLQAQKRFLSAIDSIISGRRGGDIAMVSHAGVIRLFICALKDTGMDRFWDIPIPYGSVSVFEAKASGLRYAKTIKPARIPDEHEVNRLYLIAGTAEAVIEHCNAVAAVAKEIGDDLVRRGHILDIPLISAAALTHDLYRSLPAHPERAAALLRNEGYESLSEVVSTHSELPADDERICERAVLFLADKLVLGARRVTIDERFSRSLGKCKTQQAKNAHARKKAQAQRIYELFKSTF